MMATLKSLRELAKYYDIRGRSKLDKSGLLEAIANIRTDEFIKRLKRAQKTGRFSSIREDVENPHKRGRRARELHQLDDEVTASLRAKKYDSDAKRNPLLRRQSLKRITKRAHDNLKYKPKKHFAKTEEEDLTWYKLFVPQSNGFCLFSDGSFVKRGRDIDRKTLEDDLLGFPYELQPVVRGPELSDDGAIYWSSFEPESLRVNFDMGEVVVGLLNIDRSYKLFTVVGKSPRESLQPVVEEESSEHCLTNKMINHGESIKAGAIHGIDLQLWESGREYLVFARYELRPVPIQNGEPGPMRNDKFANCFV